MNKRKLAGEVLELPPNQKISNEQFTYVNLDAEILDLVQQHTNEIKVLMHRTAQDIIQIGQRLIEVKQRLGHGNFTNWLKFEFSWSVSTATKFMHVAEQLKFVKFTNLNISASALYIIAAPSTSKDARAEVLKRAVMGENISYTQAKEIVTKYKNQSESQTEKLETTNNIDVCHELEEYDTSAMISAASDFRGKESSFKGILPILPSQLASVGAEEKAIVNFSQEKVYNSAQIVNNRINKSSGYNDPELDILITEVATKLKNFSPEQLALVIEKSVEIGLNLHQLKALFQASQKASETLH